MAVGLGTFLLLLALLVLARLRWIQRRPLAICVVLSVFAHMLLIACICLARIFDVPPSLPGSEVIYVTLSDGDEFVVEEKAADERSPEESLLKETPPELVEEQVHDELTVPEPLEAPDLVEEPEPEEIVEQPIDLLSPELEEPALVSPPTPVEMMAAEPEQMLENPEEPLDLLVTDEPVPTTTPEPLDAEPLEELSATEILESVATTPDRETSLDDEPPKTTDRVSDELAAVSAGSDDQLAPVGSVPGIVVTKSETTVEEKSVSSGSEWIPRQEPEPVVVHSGIARPEQYRFRNADHRLEAARRLGGSAESEAAVEAALLWLVRNQSSDGRWDALATGAGRVGSSDGHARGRAGLRADTGITGLALLALMGAGHTHQQGVYKSSVNAGLNFLLLNQASEGQLSGAAGNYARMYCHGIATLAVSEMLCMTGDQRLEQYLRRAINFTLRSQDPHGGGWRYHPGQAGDLSQFGWQVMALCSAAQSGIKVPPRNRLLMERFLQNTLSRGGALASYRPGENPTVSMTAEAMACRVFLGHPVNSIAMDRAARYVRQHRPGSGQANFYFWYYASLALSQRNDGDWRRWNHALQTTLLRLQRKDSILSGSWDSSTVWGGHGGRVYATAMATLCLEVYYRYLPIYERTAVK